ncbi:unnamed protein product, partial [Rhizoctonia solani]
ARGRDRINCSTSPSHPQTRMLGHQETPEGLNILCIDGGGVRGLSSLIILQEIMRRIQNKKSGEVHPYEHFDIIAGTGTGGNRRVSG